MACLQALVIGRQRDAAPDQRLAFGLSVAEMLGQAGGVGSLEVEFRKLALGPLEYLAVGDAPIPGRPIEVQIVDALDALDVHRQSFKAIGQLGRDRIAFDTADLLEIRELTDFHAVEPDLPAEAPGPQGRALPIVLDKADIVARRVNAERREAAKIEVLAVGRRRLQDDLELVVM